MSPREFAETLIYLAIQDMEWMTAREVAEDLWPDADRTDIEEAFNMLFRAKVVFE